MYVLISLIVSFKMQWLIYDYSNKLRLSENTIVHGEGGGEKEGERGREGEREGREREREREERREDRSKDQRQLSKGSLS